jgi:hypothetical protein
MCHSVPKIGSNIAGLSITWCNWSQDGTSAGQAHLPTRYLAISILHCTRTFHVFALVRLRARCCAFHSCDRRCSPTFKHPSIYHKHMLGGPVCLWGGVVILGSYVKSISAHSFFTMEAPLSGVVPCNLTISFDSDNCTLFHGRHFTTYSSLNTNRGGDSWGWPFAIHLSVLLAVISVGVYFCFCHSTQ